MKAMDNPALCALFNDHLLPKEVLMQACFDAGLDAGMRAAAGESIPVGEVVEEPVPPVAPSEPEPPPQEPEAP